jgi:hypothetical protein
LYYTGWWEKSIYLGIIVHLGFLDFDVMRKVKKTGQRRGKTCHHKTNLPYAPRLNILEEIKKK